MKLQWFVKSTRFKKGQYFGEHSLLNNSNNLHNIKAITDSQFAILTKVNFEKAIKKAIEN